MKLQEAEKKAAEYLQGELGAQQVKITESKLSQVHTHVAYIVSGELVDKDGEKQTFEVGVEETNGDIVSRKMSPVRKPIVRTTR